MQFWKCLHLSFSQMISKLFVLDNILSPWAVMQECCMWRVYSPKCRIRSVGEILSGIAFSPFSAALGSFPGSYLVRREVWWDSPPTLITVINYIGQIKANPTSKQTNRTPSKTYKFFLFVKVTVDNLRALKWLNLGLYIKNKNGHKKW